MTRGSLRPCLGTTRASRRRVTFRQPLLGRGLSGAAGSVERLQLAGHYRPAEVEALSEVAAVLQEERALLLGFDPLRQRVETQVSEAVASDEETEAYVQQLEERRDALGNELDMPSKR